MVKEISYDSFGTILSDSNPAFAVPFGFAGGLHDRDTGLVKFGFRDYDPAIGRWVAKDPIFFAGGDVDLYGYVLNDPVNFVDPFGLAFDWSEFGNATALGLGLGALGGATVGAIATGPAAPVGAPVGAITGGIGGAISAAGMNIWHQYDDSDGDGIPNHADPYPTFPDRDQDGIPDPLDPPPAICPADVARCTPMCPGK
ncbi:MAG: RHS repeat-associated core domain-containing protein [Candidatus Electrothrix sp. AW3_4]|nr:RHS repeat-associated core domain-containing protein [Candidatus Electrothrix gigas]